VAVVDHVVLGGFLFWQSRQAGRRVGTLLADLRGECNRPRKQQRAIGWSLTSVEGVETVFLQADILEGIGCDVIQ
jgi:hypothetical protein